MTYLIVEGMRAISPEFHRAYKEWRARRTGSPSSHPLKGLVTKKQFQEALSFVGLNDNHELAKLLSVKPDRASRLRNNPDLVTLAQYEVIYNYAKDAEAEKDIKDAEAEEDIKAAGSTLIIRGGFDRNLPFEETLALNRAAFFEAKWWAWLISYSALTNEHRRLIESLVKEFLKTDCESGELLKILNDTFKFHFYHEGPELLCRLIASDFQKAETPKTLESFLDGAMLQLFDEYTSPREEDVNQ